jgi:tetratricopeptide (TPR) repeat protein
VSHTPSGTSFTPERWRRLQELFELAQPLDAERRTRFLLEECGEDVSLREQVVALLLAGSDAHDDFEQRYEQAIADVLREPELPAGTIIGRYRVQRLLGRGGMGAVYLAERADQQYHQTVALKLVGRNLLHAGVASRFRSERQILARLNHPNIARLLDGGHIEDGTPYLVMEYVEGQRIDHYCSERRLPVSARLRLMQQVCAAVQYAHQNLIVHRDLKAANIMVAGDGVPKLLDFGIAKLLDAEAPAPDLTRLRDRVLTPEYASPEQLRGQPVGTASDVYNMGRLLYELLTGLSPYGNARRSLAELEHLICEQTPPLPSVRVQAEAAHGPSSSQRALGRELAGDLDNIVLKAMHVDPARRYPTANAFARDIQSYLDGRPVQARPDTFTYRAGKFLRRNAWSTASAAAVVVLIAGLTAFYTSRLAAERDRATLAANQSKQVAGFLAGIFRVPDPWRGPGKPISAIEMLDRAAGDIEQHLQNEPIILSELLYEIADSYKGLADYERASRMLERSLAVKAHARLTATPEYGETLYELANVQRFQGRFPAAEQNFRRALALQRRLFHAPHADIAATLTHLGMLYSEMGRWRESLALEREALPMTIAVYGTLHEESADRMNNLALALQGAGQFLEAQQSFQRAIAIQAQVMPPLHPDSLGTKSNLGGLLDAMGHYRAAERQIRGILADRRAVLGDGHPRLAYTLTAFGGTLTSLGNFDEAERVLSEARDSLTERLGPTHYRTGYALRGLGYLALARGDAVSAEDLFRRVERIEVSAFGETSEDVYRVRSLIATALLREGRVAEAAPLLERSYEKLYAAGQPVSGRYDRTLVELGGVRLTQGRLDEAAALFRKSLQNYERFGVPNHPDTADALLGLAQVARGRHEVTEAVAFANRALTNLRAELPDTHWKVAGARASLAQSMALARGPS